VTVRYINLLLRLRYDGLLCKIIEGRMKGKPTRRKIRLQMLHDLIKVNDYDELK